MRVSLNWLKELVDIDVSLDELAHQLTMLGLEIESIERLGEGIEDVVVGKILSIEPHPDADKLVVCKTEVGREAPLQIVCGAKNMQAGDLVPTACVGATLPGGFKIGRRKMRGIESQGMMCSSRELGLGEDHSGLMILPENLPLGEDVRPLLGLDDVVFEIEVTPNRGDWAGMIGVARELAALYKTQMRLPELRVEEAGRPVEELTSVTIEDPERCPRYLGRVASDVAVKPSPAWLARCLIAAGQRPINNIVDITNYVLLETGHPLHAFDFEILDGRRVVVRTARDGEQITTIDHEERTLRDDMLVIADAKRPQAVAGIMGGAGSEVSEHTRNVFIESAVFEPGSIRATSRALGLVTESSQRFQRGADPNMAAFAVERAAMLMQELADATIAAGKIDAHPRPLTPARVHLRYARANQVLGTKIPATEQRDMLERLGFAAAEEAEQGATFTVPTWRPDVSLEADLIEEVGRLYNYDNIPVSLPRVRQSAQLFAPHEREVRRLRNALVGMGLTEWISWTFDAPEAVRAAGQDALAEQMVMLENPLSEKQAGMRPSLAPCLLRAAAYNLNHGAGRIAAFELGPVFTRDDSSELPNQALHLGILLCGRAQQRHWSQQERPFDFYDLKGRLEAVGDFFNTPLELKPTQAPPHQAGEAADVLLDETRIGALGKVNTRVLQAFEIDALVYLLELDLDALLRRGINPTQFQALAPYPPSLRDMAVVVGQEVAAGDVIALARQAGGKLLQHVELFDVYTGKSVPEGKKSLALGLVFQSPERTLTDKDTQKSWDRILGKLQQEVGAELR